MGLPAKHREVKDGRRRFGESWVFKFEHVDVMRPQWPPSGRISTCNAGQTLLTNFVRPHIDAQLRGPRTQHLVAAIQVVAGVVAAGFQPQNTH